MKNTHSRWLQNLLAAAALTGAVVLAQADDGIPTAPHQDFAALLAQANLSQKGIANPTAAELDNATKDVQAMRTSGMGWGAIANSLGLRLGEVVSAANRSARAEDATSTAAGKSKSVAARKGEMAGVAQAGAGGGGGAGGHGGGHGGGNGKR